MRLLAFLLLFLASFSVPSIGLCQEPKQDIAEELSRNPFRAALLKAADAAAKKGELRRLDVVRLRVASLSPAFVERAQQLAVLQMSASGDDLGDLPIGEDGKIEVSRIDWQSLIEFIERLVPLILKLIDLFAFNAGGQFYAVA